MGKQIHQDQNTGARGYSETQVEQEGIRTLNHGFRTRIIAKFEENVCSLIQIFDGADISLIIDQSALQLTVPERLTFTAVLSRYFGLQRTARFYSHF
jgi:hypothetical protein